MKDFRGKVAVVTGAASGIGRALAEELARQQMRVVLADVEQPALERAVTELRVAELDVTGVVTDVSNLSSVENLAREARSIYGNVHVLCNNAGVGGSGRILHKSTIKDWQWILGINLWGVIYGTHVFVPEMLEHGEECHIVNTASVAGLFAPLGIYSVSKHAVIGLSESLRAELQQADAKIGVSVLCPAYVRTGIGQATRNRPAHLINEDEDRAAIAAINQLVENGSDPRDIAVQVLDAIREDQFWILTHPELNDRIRARTEAMLAPPTGYRRSPRI